MEVVLNETVKKLGYKGEVVSVKSGYFRNFLSPRGLADYASLARLKLVELRKGKIIMEKQQVLENAKEVLEKLKGLTITISKKVTAKGDKLYAAINEADVLKAIEAACKVQLEKEHLRMDHFKDIGEHEVIVHLGEGLETKINVKAEAIA